MQFDIAAWRGIGGVEKKKAFASQVKHSNIEAVPII